MDLLDKVEETTMTNVLVFYDTNLVSFAICAMLPPTNVEQEGLGVE
jgi:hypothetical protein